MDEPMRKLNTKFFVILAVTLALLTGAVFGLHRLQAGNIAEALLWQANQAEKDGKLDRAAKYLGRYLEFARDDLDQRERLGMILSEPQLATTPQNRARARFVIEQVLAKDPQRHALRERLCQSLIASRSFEPAKEHLNYLTKNHAASAEVPYLLGLWHEGQNQNDRACDAYRQTIKLDPGKVDAYLRLTTLLKQVDFGKEPRHAEEIDRLVVAALEKAPHDASVLSLAAQHAQEKGNTPIALHYLEDGLKQNPSEPRLYLALARIHGQNGKRGVAIEKLQLGLQHVRKDQQYDLRWSLANLLLDDNRMEDARKIITALRDAHPLSADYLEARCDMLRGRWFEAARQFEKIRPALKSVKELAFQLDLNLGVCYEQVEESALQLNALQRAAEADPTSLAAQRGVANARWAMGQTGEALQNYQDLVARTKDPDEAAQRRIEYVRLLMQSGQLKSAKDWRKVEHELGEIDKTLAKSLDAALLRAECYFAQGDVKKAEDSLTETIKDHPDRFEPWLALISSATEKKEPTQASQLMQTAEGRFKDKAAFRLAQIRHWSRYYDPDAQAALRNLENNLQSFPPRDQSSVLQAMAEAHYWAAQYRDAGRVLETVVKMPIHAHDLRVRMQLVELAILQSDDARAQAVLADIKHIDGDGVDWSFGEAVRLIRTGPKTRESLERARHLLTVAGAQRPNWHPIIQARAELDELQGRPDQAIANYRRAVDLGSRDPRAMKQLLVLLSQAQRFDEVEQVLLRMQKQYGSTEEVARLYVVHSYNRHDFKRAEEMVRRVVATDSKNFRDHLWMGQILSTTGQSPADAEKALRRAVELAPDQPETWINLVRHLILVGQHADAAAEMDRAAKALPADRKYLTLAQCCELRGMFKDAAGHFESALKETPNSALVYRAAADFLMRVANHAPAEPLYRKIYERQVPASDSEIRDARRGLALALVRQQDPRKAGEALQLVGLSLDERGMIPDGKFAESFDEQLIQAKVLGSLNHHKLRLKAASLLEDLKQKNALHPDDQYFLARLLARQAGADPVAWAKTRNLLKSLTLGFPKNARYLAFAAQQHLAQKEFADAEPIIARLEAVERERKIPPGGFGSIELRAKLLELRGLGAQATALLTDYANQPEAAPVRKLLVANMQGRLGNYRAAIDLCEEVRQAAPDYFKDNEPAAAALALEAKAAAVAILRTNKPSEALLTQFGQWQEQRQRVEAILQDAIKQNPKDSSSRLHLADLMELQGKHLEVEKLCREVLRENDTNLVALNNLAWLLGQNAVQGAEALTLIERAIEKHGPRPELLDTRAIILLNKGDVDHALRDLERVVNEAPTPLRLFHLSRAYERARNATSTLAMLRQANEQGLTLQQLHPAEQTEYQRMMTALGKRQ
jgi:tetratricopeptide (TPR) repeat protein